MRLNVIPGRVRRAVGDRRFGASTALVALALALGSCSWVSDQMQGTALQGGWLDPATFWGTEPQPQTLSADAAVDESQPFPNLATVPDEAPATTSPTERSQIAEGLSADRGNAEYTDEALTGQPSNIASAAPPPPAEGSAPSLAEAAPVESMPAEPAEPASAESMPSMPETAPQVAALPPSSSEAVTVDMSALETPAAPAYAPAATTAEPAAPAMAALPTAAPSGVGQPIGLIYFEHGSSSLDREAHSVLRNIAQIAQSGGTVKIIGHASMRTKTMDLTDHKLVNFDVSVARAGAVANELIRLGVRPEQVQIAGAGDQLPVFAEFMPTGEAGNRRTEIYLYQ